MSKCVNSGAEYNVHFHESTSQQKNNSLRQLKYRLKKLPFRKTILAAALAAFVIPLTPLSKPAYAGDVICPGRWAPTTTWWANKKPKHDHRHHVYVQDCKYGGDDIKDNTVDTRDIKNYTIKPEDLSQNVAGPGLGLHKYHGLYVKPGHGIKVKDDKVHVKIDGPDSGLEFDNKALQVKDGHGIVVNKWGINANVDHKTLTIKNDKIKVKRGGIKSKHIANYTIRSEDIKNYAITGKKLNPYVAGKGLYQDRYGNLNVGDFGNNGLMVTKNNIMIKSTKYDGLSVGRKGLSINTGRGIKIKNDKVVVNIHGKDSGLEFNNKALQVKDGHGIVVNKWGINANVDHKTLTIKNDKIKVKKGGIRSKHIKNNTIRSEDIKNNTIRSIDIKNNTIRSVDIKNNTIRSRDIKNNTIRSVDIKDNTIRSRDIKNNTIRSRDIRNNTIRSEDIKDGTIAFDDLSPEVNDKIQSNMMATLENADAINNNRHEIDKNKQGIALAMAIANAPIFLEGENTFSLSVGLGFFDHEEAAAVKGALKVNQNMILTGSVAFTNDETAGGVGIGFGF